MSVSLPDSPPAEPAATASLPDREALAFGAACAVGAVVLLGWAVMWLTWPPTRDQGIFAWLGAIVADGGVPYRDAWDTKGPMVFWISALADIITGGSIQGIRIVDLGLGLVAAAGLAVAARPWAGRRGAVLAALFYLLWLADLSGRARPQPDGWVAALLVVGFVPLLRERVSAGGWIAAGVAVACATLIKPLYALYAAVPIARALANRHEPGRGRGLALSAGAAAVIGLLTLGWFWSQGALTELWNAQVTFNLGTYAGGGGRNLAGRIEDTLMYLTTRPVLVVLTPAAILGLVALRDRRFLLMPLIAWGVVAIVSVPLQGWFFSYHWLPFHPLLALLSVLGLHELHRHSGRAGRVVAAATVLFALATTIRRPLQDVLVWRRAQTGEISESHYLARFKQYGDPIVLETERVARYLVARTSPDDPILVWGTQPVLYRLADRRPASRFGFNLPLVAGADTPLRRRYRALFLQELAAAPPAYIVVVAGDTTRLVPLASDEYIERFPAFEALLAREYCREEAIGRFRLYRRRTS